jgi:hypothetical protein
MSNGNGSNFFLGTIFGLPIFLKKRIYYNHNGLRFGKNIEAAQK